MVVLRCDYCGSEGECYDDCECSKCVDPEGYEEWKNENPDEYDAWIEKKLIEEEEGY